MSRRNEKRPDSRPGSEDGTQRLPLEPEPGAAAAFAAGFAEFADEPGLGATDGWDAKQDAYVGGYAKAPGMGDTLPVDEYEVGLPAERGDGFQDGGAFPEGQESGHIGKAEFAQGDSVLDRLE